MFKKSCLILIIMMGFLFSHAQKTYRMYYSKSQRNAPYYALMNKFNDTIMAFKFEGVRKAKFGTDSGTYYVLRKKRSYFITDSTTHDTLAWLSKAGIFYDRVTHTNYRMVKTFDGFLFFNQLTDTKEFEGRLEYASNGYKITCTTKFDDFRTAPLFIAWFKTMLAVPW